MIKLTTQKTDANLFGKSKWWGFPDMPDSLDYPEVPVNDDGDEYTDPPTLAFANTVAPEGCKLPNMGYATVYPLTMFLRIFTAQLLVLMAV